MFLGLLVREQDMRTQITTYCSKFMLKYRFIHGFSQARAQISGGPAPLRTNMVTGHYTEYYGM